MGAPEELLSAIDQELSPEQSRETYDTLLKVLSNIVKHPAEQKYRSLKKDNKIVAEKLSRSPSAISVLLALGFEDDGSLYRCPLEADITILGETVDILECILASRETDSAPTTAAPSGRPTPTSTGSPASLASPASGPSKATATSTKGFARRSDEERRREEHARELEAARAAHRAQFAEGGGAAAALRAGAASPASGAASPSSASVSSGKAPAAKPDKKSAFEFQSRAKQEAEKANAANSLEELRRQQREKFKEFEADPNARQAAVYQQPPAVAPGGKVDGSWGDWFGSFFSGGSSGSSGNNGGGDERKGPRMKTINDLPKPVQRG